MALYRQRWALHERHEVDLTVQTDDVDKVQAAMDAYLDHAYGECDDGWAVDYEPELIDEVPISSRLIDEKGEEIVDEKLAAERLAEQVKKGHHLFDLAHALMAPRGEVENFIWPKQTSDVTTFMLISMQSSDALLAYLASIETRRAVRKDGTLKNISGLDCVFMICEHVKIMSFSCRPRMTGDGGRGR